MRLSFFSVLLLLALFPFLALANDKEGIANFSRCLADRGAIMYSAWWCKYCVGQLQDFDPSLPDDLFLRKEASREKMATFPFVKECAGEEPGSIDKTCVPKDLRGVPTWKFKSDAPVWVVRGGTKRLYQGGGMAFEELAKETGCPEPKLEEPK